MAFHGQAAFLPWNIIVRATTLLREGGGGGGCGKEELSKSRRSARNWKESLILGLFQSLPPAPSDRSSQRCAIAGLSNKGRILSAVHKRKENLVSFPSLAPKSHLQNVHPAHKQDDVIAATTSREEIRGPST